MFELSAPCETTCTSLSSSTTPRAAPASARAPAAPAEAVALAGRKAADGEAGAAARGGGPAGWGQRARARRDEIADAAAVAVDDEGERVALGDQVLRQAVAHHAHAD